MRSLKLDARQYIKNANDNIESNIDLLCPNHIGLCAQNILGQSRNLLDGFALLQYGTDYPTSNIDNALKLIQDAQKHLIQKGKNYRCFVDLYSFLQVSASHYTQNIFDSESLLLKYSDYLFDIRESAKTLFDIDILSNLEDFPFSNKEDEEYYRSIKDILLEGDGGERTIDHTYYIERRVRRRFGIYEYVLSPANDKRTKFDRLTAFSLTKINDSHSIKCRFVKKKLTHNGITIQIVKIVDWSISIRPCEIQKLAFIQHLDFKINRNTSGYMSLMDALTANNCSLYDFIISPSFESDLDELLLDKDNKIRRFLEETRKNINTDKVGSKTLKYLLFICLHSIIKYQIIRDPEKQLGDYSLNNRCYAFDSHPFSLSLINHNPKLSDLLDCLPEYCTNEELLKRTIVINTEDRKMLYTPVKELDKTFNTLDYAKEFNKMLVEKTKGLAIEFFNNHAYIKSYEEHTISILNALIAKRRIVDPDYESVALPYISSLRDNEIDNEKIGILKKGFTDSSVLLINGAAGTGKTTLIKHFSNIFKDKKILYLSCTNSSVQNLQIKVGKSDNRTFMTLERFRKKMNTGANFNHSILIVDECSMVENEAFDFVLKNMDFEKMLLVGDERQIESIKFGNWFGIVNSLLDCGCELTFTHRTTDKNLQTIWDAVRELEQQDRLCERIINAGYHHQFDSDLFIPKSSDEIILCLNYDGLYGINNINRYLQESNPNKAVSWKVWTFKVGDRVLFNESYYFRDYFYNNQKGIIESIEDDDYSVTFIVYVNSEPTNNHSCSSHVRWIKEEDEKDYYSIRIDKDDDDDEEDNSTKVLVVPFQLGYAISIHKSQGLEYDSVKVIMTKEVEEQVTHNVFYTAITRAKKFLSIYCDKESLSRIINSFEKQTTKNDAEIIKQKYNL